MKTGYDVIGLGAAVMDLIATSPRWPELDEKIHLSDIAYEGGGETATALVTVDRLGHTASLSAIVGEDYLGHMVRDGLEKEGVDVSRLIVRPGNRTPFAFCVVEEEAYQRTIFFAGPKGAGLDKHEVDPEWVASSRYLLVDGWHMPAAVQASRYAREAGVPVIMDGCRVRIGQENLLPNVDYLIACERYAREFAGEPEPEKALEVLASGPHRFVGITLGHRGFIGRDENGVFRIPAFHVPVRDTTGAGDVFHGAFAVGLLKGWDVRKTARFASAVAALKCRALGGRSAIPGFDETLRFLAQYEE